MENYNLPPKFSPDNSEEAKQSRVANHHFLFPKVTEIKPPKHRVTPDIFIEPSIVLSEGGQVIEVNFRPDPPGDLAA